MTQADLARLLDVTRQTIIAVEKDRYDPSLSLAYKIAALFELPVEEIFLRNTCDKTVHSGPPAAD